MRLTEDIKSITYIRTHPSDLIREVNTNKRPIVITQKGTARAVLMDVETYEKQKNTLLMLKLVAQGEYDIKNDRLSEQEKVFKKIDAILE